MKNAINWFEIPAKNFDRAKSFYETVLGIKIHVVPHPTNKYGVFPADMENGQVGGALSEGEGCEPSGKGSLVYLNGGDDLSVPLSKVEKAGGKIVMPKISIGQNGFMAHFTDTEGNKVALHSMK
jgi:predicted enzyme related to lactoylglutathione lyase